MLFWDKCLSFSPAQRSQARVQAVVAAVTWGSVPKMRLRAFHLLCCWCWAGAPFPAHSGLFPASWRCRAHSPLPALGAGSPVLTAILSARSWTWGPYPALVPLGWSPGSGGVREEGVPWKGVCHRGHRVAFPSPCSHPLATGRGFA